jgi:FkbM family methyltransferase
MFNFSGISRDSFCGRILRWPLRVIPKSTVVRVLQGELKGSRWIVGAATHGCWLGSYECGKQRLFAKSIGAGQIVYDVGANVGFYTLLAARAVGETGRVYAFEPLPENLSYLRRHLDLNEHRNVVVESAAVSDVCGIVRFRTAGNRSSGHLSLDGDVETTSVSVDEYVFQRKNPPPHVMKIDVEGAEYGVLRGAREVLMAERPLIFLATHGRDVHQQCREFLTEALDYDCQEIAGDGNELLCVPRESGPMRP